MISHFALASYPHHTSFWEEHFHLGVLTSNTNILAHFKLFQMLLMNVNIFVFMYLFLIRRCTFKCACSDFCFAVYLSVFAFWQVIECA